MRHSWESYLLVKLGFFKWNSKNTKNYACCCQMLFFPIYLLEDWGTRF